jgi:hypothetical protein
MTYDEEDRAEDVEHHCRRGSSTADEKGWSDDEEAFLADMARVCRELSQRYHDRHLSYLMRQRRTRLPLIGISGVSGMVSFGSELFPPHMQPWVQIAVGACAMIVALVGSIESFLKISETAAASLRASLNMERLAESINLELSIPRAERSSQSGIYMSACHAEFQKNLELAPAVLHKIRFLPLPSDAIPPSNPPTPRGPRRSRRTLAVPIPVWLRRCDGEIFDHG